jgi:haloacetate dehalogenase
MMFDGFALDHVDVGEATLRVRYGGTGPPIVLVHGHPRTHVTWHKVASELARTHTVVCPDLRGYGQSSKPAPGADFSGYGKRAMARDIHRLMAVWGTSGTPWPATTGAATWRCGWRWTTRPR